MKNKFKALTSESGDWTVLLDPRGEIIYSGHDSVKEITENMSAWFGYEIEKVVVTQEEMEHYG